MLDAVGRLFLVTADSRKEMLGNADLPFFDRLDHLVDRVGKTDLPVAKEDDGGVREHDAGPLVAGHGGCVGPDQMQSGLTRLAAC